MPRPALTDLAAGQTSAEAVINQNNAVLTGGPFPIKVYATPGDLPAAGADNVNCLAATTTPKEMWMSDGSAWRTYGVGHPNANGARGGRVVVSSERTLPADATWANARPAGVRDVAVSMRVTQAVTSGDGATSFDLGDGTDADRYADDVPFTLGTTKTAADSTADPGGWHAAAGNIVLTPNGGTFSGGKVRVVLMYDELTAPTS